jgi:hypothetical protein
MDARAEVNRPRLGRTVLNWSAAVALVIVLFVAAVITLNLTVFSASGFVTTYLQTLSAGDIQGALGMPGVHLPHPVEMGSPEAALLDSTAVGSIDDIHLVDDVEDSAGTHHVTMAYTLLGAGRTSQMATTEFDVKSTGVMFAVFNHWTFTKSPVATLTVQVQNASTATVGTRELTASDLDAPNGAFSATRDFSILVPGLYVTKHSSPYLDSEVQKVAAITPGASERAVVAATPTAEFESAVQKQVNSFLAACATQSKLFPAGCPFSKSIDDRIVGEPAWSIGADPTIKIVADAKTWVVAQCQGVAHITVDVESLFDGTVSTLDEDVPFTVSYSLVLAPDGSITFLPR